VNTDLNKKITGLDRRGKEQEALHKKQVGEELYKILFDGIATKMFATIPSRIFTEKIACKITKTVIISLRFKIKKSRKFEICENST
jgi:hypothetical protein